MGPVDTTTTLLSTSLSLSLSEFLLSVFLARKEGEEAETGRGGT